MYRGEASKKKSAVRKEPGETSTDSEKKTDPDNKAIRGKRVGRGSSGNRMKEWRVGNSPTGFPKT